MVHFHIFPPDFHASSCYYYFCLNCHLLKRLHKKILIFPHFVSIFSIPLCKSIFSPTIIFLTPGGLPSKFLWCWLAKNKCLHFSHVWKELVHLCFWKLFSFGIKFHVERFALFFWYFKNVVPLPSHLQFFPHKK